MNCPKCKGETAVIDSRSTGQIIRRRRECDKCKARYTTFELIANIADATRMSQLAIVDRRKLADAIRAAVQVALTTELLQPIPLEINDADKASSADASHG